MEIFDWLRGLDDTHELAGLCDVYTYTTMISQCGSHQQLRRWGREHAWQDGHLLTGAGSCAGLAVPGSLASSGPDLDEVPGARAAGTYLCCWGQLASGIPHPELQGGCLPPHLPGCCFAVAWTPAQAMRPPAAERLSWSLRCGAAASPATCTPTAR